MLIKTDYLNPCVPISGHRRVGSGSNITHKTPTWDSSPRTLKLNNATASTTTTRSATASPKKLDKYAVAKIAASLFHSPAGTTKLESSQSQRTSSSSRRRVEKKRGNHNDALILTAGELVVPGGAHHHPDVGSPFPTTEESVPARSSSCSVQHMEGTNFNCNSSFSM